MLTHAAKLAQCLFFLQYIFVLAHKKYNRTGISKNILLGANPRQIILLSFVTTQYCADLIDS
ncbi:MAG: hypothetical protein EAZ57_09355 [Cytophagales bacterium]|nr:MAG: hypothetical protein EAZ67_10160 [Cytophagales bacterium]TAF59973.1 MAG: hypothetical protein EAZ57_09355 [Cytophagales bacterium]